MSKHVGEIVDRQDPWHEALDSYDVTTYYTRSTDGRGHYEQLRNVKISSSLHAVLSQMIHERAIPEYRSIADVIRDSLIHRMHYVKANFDRLSTPINAEIVLGEMHVRQARNQQRQEVIDAYEDQLRQFEKDEDWQAIVDGVDAMGTLVDEWEDTRHGDELSKLIEQYAQTAKRRLRLLSGSGGGDDQGRG